MCPSIDNLVITLGIGDEAEVVVIGDLTDLIVTSLDELLLLWWDDDIVKVE